MNIFVSNGIHGENVWIHAHSDLASVQLSLKLTPGEAVSLGRELIGAGMGMDKLLAAVPDE